MFGDSRSLELKSRLARSVALAALLSASCIAYGILEASRYEQQADNKVREYSAYTREKVAETCIGNTSVERLKCVNEAFEAQREYEYNQSDLVAQRKSALWAFLMGAAAIIGMALSAFGVWLVKATFDATKKANDIAKETYFAQDRPWLDVSIVDAKVICNECPEPWVSAGLYPRWVNVVFYIEITNTRGGPAFITDWAAQFHGDFARVQHATVRLDAGQTEKFAVGNGLSRTLLNGEDARRLRTEFPPIHGFVRYFTLHGDSREFGFGLKARNIWSLANWFIFGDMGWNYDRPATDPLPKDDAPPKFSIRREIYWFIWRRRKGLPMRPPDWFRKWRHDRTQKKQRANHISPPDG